MMLTDDDLIPVAPYVRSNIWNKVITHAWVQTKHQVNDQMWDKVRIQVRNKINRQIRDQVRNIINNANQLW
jgi:hypothetical protein